MRHLLLIALTLLIPGTAQAGTTEVHLLTMGPGEHLYTGGGHAALLVAEGPIEAGTPTKVYNYGDTDWEQGGIPAKWLLGTLDFFLAPSGDLADTVRAYGFTQKRTIYRQKLNLTDAQIAALKKHLAWEVVRGNGDYRFHHFYALCTTKIRDVVDQFIDGQIAAQLTGQPQPNTIRDEQHKVLYGHLWATFGADLLMGSLHDRPVDQWTVLGASDQLRERLQQVQVDDPAGSGQKVPLAEAPIVIVEVDGTWELEVGNRATTLFCVLWMLVALLLGAVAWRQLPEKSEKAGAWVLLWAPVTGLVGLVAVGLFAFSNVAELRYNELVFVFLPSNLLLILPAIAWLRGAAPARWVRHYALANLGIVSLACVARLLGLTPREPSILFVTGFVFALGLQLLVSRAQGGGMNSMQTPV